MHTPEQIDRLMVKWRERAAREKAEVISSFLSDCGENGTWEEWLVFLHEQDHVKGVEWTHSVD